MITAALRGSLMRQKPMTNAGYVGFFSSGKWDISRHTEMINTYLCCFTTSVLDLWFKCIYSSSTIITNIGNGAEMFVYSLRGGRKMLDRS